MVRTLKGSSIVPDAGKKTIYISLTLPMSPVRDILREAWRVSALANSELIKRKIRFNAREMVEFYARLDDPIKSRQQLASGWKILGTLRRMLTADPALVNEVFKPFDYMEKVVAPKGETTRPDSVRID